MLMRLATWRVLLSANDLRVVGCVTRIQFIGKSTARTAVGGKEKRLQSVVDGKSVLEQVLLEQPSAEPKTRAQKVRQSATNSFFYVFLAGSVAAFGYLGYFMFQQFFSSDSPHTVFSQALKMIRKDAYCADLFGEPIAGFGEETSRGRRRHVQHLKYEKNGSPRIRVMFHLKGSRKQGVAHAEKHYVDGSWEFRYLLVETLDIPRRSHVLIDNRTEGN